MAAALSARLPSPCRPAKHPRHYTAAVPASPALHTVTQSAYMRAPRKARPSSLSHMPTARTLRHARPLKAARASRRTLPTDARSDRGRAGQQLRTARLLPRLRVRPPAAPSQLARSLIRPHEGRRKGPVRQYARSPATELSERHPLASMGRAMGTPSRARAEQSHPARRGRACAH